jgi:signal peptidase II
VKIGNFQKKLLLSLSVVFVLLFIDQFLKIWIKTHFFLGETIYVFGLNWFQIHFVENYGMAFGMEFAGNYGKIFLSIFRLIAIGGICWYLYTLIKKNASIFFIVTISLILAGAAGNLFDSAFYGLIFSESTPFDKAVMFSQNGGYADFLYGRVVDMFYFPLFTIKLPNWFPFWGGQPFTFFEPVWNIADGAITVGVFILIIFQKRLFKSIPQNRKEKNTTEPAK